MLDEGFRQPVRRLDFTGMSITRDNKFLTPDGSYSIPYRSCSRSHSMEDTSTEEAYQGSFSRDVAGSLSGSSGGFSASGSASYATRTQRASAASERQATFQAKSYCTKYKVGWLQGGVLTRPEEVMPQLATVLGQVLKTYKVMKACLEGSPLRQRMWDLARAQWLEVFRTFGTHIVDEITLGGKVVFTKMLSESATEDAKQEGVDISVEV